MQYTRARARVSSSRKFIIARNSTELFHLYASKEILDSDVLFKYNITFLARLNPQNRLFLTRGRLYLYGRLFYFYQKAGQKILKILVYTIFESISIGVFSAQLPANKHNFFVFWSNFQKNYSKN